MRCKPRDRRSALASLPGGRWSALRDRRRCPSTSLDGIAGELEQRILQARAYANAGPDQPEKTRRRLAFAHDARLHLVSRRSAAR
jgi:hypothetical protein